VTRAIGLVLIAVALFVAAAAPALAPRAPDAHLDGLLDAPPTAIHIQGDDGAWHAPFIYRWQLVNQLEQQYQEDRSSRVALSWFTGGHLVQSSNDAAAPLLLLGSDSFGRDVFARLVHGARVSLALALTAALGAMIAGAALGGLAGYAGGSVDETLMRAIDFVMVLPTIYVALALRAVLPLVLSGAQVFALLAGIFAIVGAPFVARGVRAIVRGERRREYPAAALALGASHTRVLIRHLLPAARGFILLQITLLVPAFIIAEATLSYVGLGFPDSVASWGTMLHDASTNIRVFADFPWLLSPAAAMFLVVLGVNLAVQHSGRRGIKSWL
jgi:peptide/nickel transport system permease protein